MPSFILAILASGSLFETQSWFESFLPECCACGPGAPGHRQPWVFDAALLGQALVDPPACPRRCPSADVAQRRVRLHGRGIDLDDVRSPFRTRPRASAIRSRTQSKIVKRVPSWGRRARVRDSQEWSATDPGFPAVETPVATGNRRAAPFQPALRVDASLESSPAGACGKARRRHRRRPQPGRCNRTSTGRLGKAVETALDQYRLQTVVKLHDPDERWHLRPAADHRSSASCRLDRGRVVVLVFSQRYEAAPPW